MEDHADVRGVLGHFIKDWLRVGGENGLRRLVLALDRLERSEREVGEREDFGSWSSALGDLPGGFRNSVFPRRLSALRSHSIDLPR